MIRENIRTIRCQIPDSVTLVAAAKTRSPDEVLQAIDAGITVIGQNYVQEAVAVSGVLKDKKARLHFIGHLQRNKVKKAVEVCDLIETVDSVKIAQEINKRAAQLDKTMPILLEVNSGREPQKFGIFPEDLDGIVADLSSLSHIQIQGLMTMGPYAAEADIVRPYFKETKSCFDRLKSADIDNVRMEILSMGMSDSYLTAIEEGATHIRIGTKIFGPR